MVGCCCIHALCADGMGCSSSSNGAVSPETDQEFVKWSEKQTNKLAAERQLREERAASSWGVSSSESDAPQTTSEALTRAMNVVHLWSQEERMLRLSLHMLFAHTDDDDSGTIDIRELVAMKNMIHPTAEELQNAESECAEILAALDKDSSGSLSEREFVEWIIDGTKKTKQTQPSTLDHFPKILFYKGAQTLSNAFQPLFSSEGKDEFQYLLQAF